MIYTPEYYFNSDQLVNKLVLFLHDSSSLLQDFFVEVIYTKISKENIRICCNKEQI